MIVSWYKTPDKPLSGTFFEEQARALIRQGLKVSILYPDIDMRFRSRFQRKSKQATDHIDNDIPTFYSFCRSIVPLSRFINYEYFKYKTDRKFKQYIKIYGRPDLIHAHCVFNAGIAAQHISAKYQVPYVITEHYSGLIIHNIAKIPINRRIVKRVYNASRTSISVSRSFADDLVRTYQLPSDQFAIVPNMVNELFFWPGGKDRSRNFVTLFSNSFLTYNKNHKLLFQAFALILQHKPNTILRVGGDGGILPELKDLAIELKLNNNIFLLGALSREKVKKELDDCDIFLSSSNYETFGIAIIEALACGRPAVATDSGGPRDIITEEDGIIVVDHAPKSFADAVLRVMNNYERYDTDLIRKRCEDRFSERKITERIINIYQQTISC